MRPIIDALGGTIPAMILFGGLISPLVAAITVLLIVLGKFSEQLGTIVGLILSSVITSFVSMAEILSSVLVVAINIVSVVIQSLIAVGLEPLVNILSGVLPTVIQVVAGSLTATFVTALNFVTAAITFLIGALGTLISILSASFRSAVTIASSLIRGFIGAISTLVRILTASLVGGIRAVVSILSGVLTPVINSARSAFQVFGGVIGAVRGIINSIIGVARTAAGAVQDLIDKISNLPGAGVVSGVVNALGNLPGLAQGGIITKPIIALIGEKSDEVVIPLDDPRRALQLASASGLIDQLITGSGGAGGPIAIGTPGGLGGGGDGAIHIEFSGPITFSGVSSAAEARKFGQAFGGGVADTLTRRRVRVAARIA
jgi:hypothetical protein